MAPRSETRIEAAILVGKLDPVVGHTAAVDSPFGKEGARRTLVLRHDPNAADGVGRGVGKIDVDEGARLPFRSKQALQNERRIFLRCFPRYLAARRELGWRRGS